MILINLMLIHKYSLIKSNYSMIKDTPYSSYLHSSPCLWSMKIKEKISLNSKKHLILINNKSEIKNPYNLITQTSEKMLVVPLLPPLIIILILIVMLLLTNKLILVIILILNKMLFLNHNLYPLLILILILIPTQIYSEMIIN